MKPKRKNKEIQKDLFRIELKGLIDKTHSLVKLSEMIDWEGLSQDFDAYYHDHMGRPGKPTRLMAGLLLLQHTFKCSDEEIVARFVENPYYQYFCGNDFFEHSLPIDPTALIKWRQRIGKEGCEKILKLTIEVGLKSKTIQKKDFKRTIADTTIQEKNIAYPTDSALYLKALEKMVLTAKEAKIMLRQTYTRTAKKLASQVSRYAHAKQYKRMKSALKSLKTLVGRVYRDIQRKLTEEAVNLFSPLLPLVERLLKEPAKDKLYSLHAPEVHCFSKGKARKRYEFGDKVAIAVTHKRNFIMGIESLEGAPYDGHTLNGTVDQIERLVGEVPEETFVDRGYKKHGVSRTSVFMSGQKTTSPSLKKRIKRRSAIEPVIGHMKMDGKLGRNYLKGTLGNSINACLSGAGYNFRTILKKIKPFFPALFFSLYPSKKSLSAHDHLFLST